jgi:hypothetical protein
MLFVFNYLFFTDIQYTSTDTFLFFVVQINKSAEKNRSLKFKYLQQYDPLKVFRSTNVIITKNA